MTIITPLIIAISLIVPPASKGTIWTMGEIHNQIQVTFENGVQASYLAVRVPCTATVIQATHKIYKTQQVCYSADIRTPVFVRSPWIPTIQRTYKPKD
jgi:hypothetical protein